jgi:hypothetical protein
MTSKILWSSIALGAIILRVGATAYAQTNAPAPPVQWNVGVTSLYEYDTNPLRSSLARGDSHWRLLPSVDVQARLSPRTTLFGRSALHRDQYGATGVLNGFGVNGSLGIARRVASRVSVWGAFDAALSKQPDVLQVSPFRFASYTQQGGSAGLVWRLRAVDVLRADGFVSRRQYRALSSIQFPVSSSRIDPVLGLGASWTHTFGGARAAWSRVALNTTWHTSNNPAYSYALPVVSGGWGTNVGRRSTLRLDGTLAWLRYDAHRVGLSRALRRDTIAEIAATVAWRRGSRVEPFVRVGQEWNRSTAPFRNFSDTRVLVGACFNLWAAGQRQAAGER